MEGREGEEKEERKEGTFIFIVLIVVKIHITNLSSLLFLNGQLGSIRYIHIVVQPIPRTFPSCKTGTLYSLKSSSPLFPAPVPFSCYDFDHSECLKQVSSYGICLFVTGLFHLVLHPQGSTMLLDQVSVFPSF